MHQLTPERQFAQLLAADPGRPLVTYYDEATGERTELSARSLANWVAKTHHLLGDELGLGLGDTALIALPAHWLAVPVLLGCLTAGLAISPDDASAEVAFVTPESAAGAVGVLDVFGIAPESPFAAVGFRGAAPEGVADYVLAVRPQADAWGSVAMPAGPDDPCLPGQARGEVAQRAAAAGLPPGARVLTTRDWTGPGDWVDTLLAPIAAGGSIVFVRNCVDEAVLARRMDQERATVRL
ncbi:TIGR03089 family protein [uncultured Jatrophihabitans sp.]|uniref:TIGR03089 family protein n=1 Tax=uncultured Jatrophihabitans sp. TaxID=1610747 RepID=UPI0035CCA1A7